MASLRDIWIDEGPGQVVSWFMDSEKAIEDLMPEEKSWVALAFAAEGWNEEAIDTADSIEEPSAQGECARAFALRGLEKPEEANRAMRQSLEIEEHFGRKNILASWLRADSERDGAGEFHLSDSEKKVLFERPSFGSNYDYSHPAYDETKRLLWDSLEGGEKGNAVVDRAATDLAQMAETEEEAVKVLRRGAERGSERSKFEFAVVRSYFASETPEGIRNEGIRKANAVFWPKALEVFEELPQVGQDGNKDSSVYELYVRFAAAAYQHDPEQSDPDTLLDIGFDLIQHTDELDAEPGEIALLCGRAAFLSGELDIAKMFYQEAREGSEPLASTTAKIEEAVAEAEGHPTLDAGGNGKSEKIVEASEQLLDLKRSETEAAGSTRGIKSGIVNDFRCGCGISVSNLALLQKAVGLVKQSRSHSEEEEGVVQVACSRALVASSPLHRSDLGRDFKEKNQTQGALKCNHPGASLTRKEIFTAQGRYGKAVVESTRSTVFNAEDREEIEKGLSVGLSSVESTIENGLEDEPLETTRNLPFLSFDDLPHEQSQEKTKERFEESHRTVRQLVEGKIYSDEIDESLRPPILREVCLTWESLIKRGSSDEKGRREKEAADVMQSAGDQKGSEPEQAIWARGVLLSQKSMLERQVSDRKAWIQQRSLLRSAQMIDSGLRGYMIAELGRTSMILGDLESAEEWFGQLSDEEPENVPSNLDSIQDQINLLKTAPDRWSGLDYYPKKLLATLTALEGNLTEEKISNLSGQPQRFVSGHIETLLEKGMLERSEILGPIWIDGVGGVRVNPFVEDLARRERSHKVQSRLIEADDDLKARQVFDSDGEYKIYRTLTDTFPNGLVFPNMSPSAIFDYDEMQEALTGDEFRYFLQSRVDFCIVSTDSYLPKVAIEVDSHFHDQDEQKKRDRKKDKIFRVGGVPLIRLRRFGDQSQEAVANQIREKIQELVEANTEEAKVLRLAGINSSPS